MQPSQRPAQIEEGWQVCASDSASVTPLSSVRSVYGETCERRVWLSECAFCVPFSVRHTLSGFGGMTIEVHRWQCKEVYDLKRAPLLDSRSGDRGLRGLACGKGEGMRQCDSLRIQYHNVIHTRQRHLPSSSIRYRVRYALLALSLTPRSHDRDYLCENMCKKVRETIERIVSRDVRRVRVPVRVV